MKIFYTLGVSAPVIHPDIENLQFDKVFLEPKGGSRTRKQLGKCISFMKPGDTLYLNCMGDLGGGLLTVLGIIQTLIRKDVNLVFASEKYTLLYNKEENKILLSVLEALVQAKRAWFSESVSRQIEEQKKENGGKLKRRPHALGSKDLEKIKKLKEQHIPIQKIADMFSVSRKTIYNYLKS